MEKINEEQSSMLETKETQTEITVSKHITNPTIAEYYYINQMSHVLILEFYLSMNYQEESFIQVITQGKLQTSEFFFQFLLLVQLILTFTLLLCREKIKKRKNFLETTLNFLQLLNTIIFFTVKHKNLTQSSEENIIERYNEICFMGVLSLRLLPYRVIKSEFVMVIILLDLALTVLKLVSFGGFISLFIMDIVLVSNLIDFRSKEEDDKGKNGNENKIEKLLEKKNNNFGNILNLKPSHHINTEANFLLGSKNEIKKSKTLKEKKVKQSTPSNKEMSFSIEVKDLEDNLKLKVEKPYFSRNGIHKKSVTIGYKNDRFKEDKFDSGIFEQQNHRNSSQSKNSIILSKIVKKITTQNSKRFKLLMKDYTNSLDQCIIIFDKFEKSIFNNYNKERWMQILGKKKSTFFNVKSLDQDPNLLWKNLFNMKCLFALQVQTETIFSILDLISLLDLEMDFFDKSKYKKELKLMERHVSQSKKDMENKDSKSNKSNISTMSHSKASMIEVDLNFIVNMVSDFIQFCKEMQNGKFGEEEDDDYFISDSLENVLKTPFIFYHQDMYIRISFRLLEGDVFCFLSVLNIGDKVLLLDLSDRLNFKNRLISSLSHELRTPLNNIIMTSSALEFDLEQDNTNLFQGEEGMDNFKREICSIAKSAKKLDILIQNVVDYSLLLSKTFVLMPYMTDLTEAVKELAELYDLNMELKGLEYRKEIEEGLKLITDGSRIKGVLSILIENAVKFTKKGKILLRVKKEKDKVVFQVKDTGQGMTNQDLEIILSMVRNPLSSMKTQKSDGIGLGLRMAYPIIKLLASDGKNRLRIKSELGKGTSIEFYADRLERVSYISQITARKNENVLNKVKSFLNEQGVVEDSGISEKSESDFNDLKKLIEIHPQYKPSTFLSNGGKSQSSVRGRRPSQEKGRNINFKNNGTSLKDGIGQINEDYLKKSSNLAFKNKFQDYQYNIFLKNDDDEKRDMKRKQTKTKAGEEKDDNDHPALNKENPSKDESLNSIKSNFVTFHKEKTSIMIVDDNELNRRILTVNIARVGNYEIFCADSGPECLSMIEDPEIEIPHLIFMDYSMPDMLGDECTKILRSGKFKEILKDTIIIGYSANDDRETVKKCLKAGMDKYQKKPVTIKILKNILKEFNI